MSGELVSQKFELYVIDDITVPATPALMKVANVTSIGEIGSQSSEIDITNLDSLAMEYIKGLGDNGEMSLELNLSPAAVSHKFMLAASKQTGTTATKKFAIVSSGGVAVPVVTAGAFVMTGVTDRTWWVGTAFVKSFRNSAIGVNSVVKTNAALRLTGPITSSMDA